MAAKALRLKIEDEPFKKLEKLIDDVDEFIDTRNAIFMEICKELQPWVRQCLLTNFDNSSVGKDGTGELKKWIAKAEVYPTTAGIKIGPPIGLSADQYSKMGAVNFGYLKNSESTNRVSRKKIKDAAQASGQKTAGGATLVPPHKYWELTNSQSSEFAKKFEELLYAKLEKAMEGN